MDLIAKAVTLKSIKLHDPSVKELVFSAKHAVLYTFSATKGTWEKTETEGCLAVYRQAATVPNSPSSASTVLFILNRLRPDNFMCPLKNIQGVQLEGDLLMLLLKNGEVMGIWLFDEGERQRILTVLQECLNDSNFGHQQQQQLKPISLNDLLLGSRSEAPPSIMDLLSKAKVAASSTPASSTPTSSTPTSSNPTLNTPTKSSIPSSTTTLDSAILSHFASMPPRTSLKEFTAQVCQFLSENPQTLSSLHRELSLNNSNNNGNK